MPRWDSLTREELAACAPRALAILPVAAVEQHGPHLPTRTDTAILEAILDRAEPRLGPDAVIAPVMCFGASDHHLPFKGTLSLRTETLRAVLDDLIRSVASCGFRRVFLLNSHGGNELTCRLVARESSARHDIVVATASYWSLLGQTGKAIPGHAGEFETSLMRHLHSKLVGDSPPRPDPGTAPASSGMAIERPDHWRRIDGYTDDPRGASAEQGAELLEQIVDRVVAAAAALGDEKIP